MRLQTTICVIGSGAVGKVTALGFAQAGHDVLLLGQAPPSTLPASQAWDVRVYALNHAARALLESVRVWDAMDEARIAPVEAMKVVGDDPTRAGRLDFDAFGARVGTLAWIVEDANLNQALDTALKFAPKVKQIAAQSRDLQISDELATITLDNGDTIEASLLVGADGAQSWVRGQCDIDIASRSYYQRAVVTNFTCALPHHDVARQWFSADEGIIALLPLPGQRVSLVWSAPQHLAQQLAGESLASIAQRLAAYCAADLGELTPLQPEVVKILPLNLLHSQTIAAPRVALVGDAAHVVHPLAGQGMNLGFADVVSLLQTVAERDAQTDCGDARVLARYARSRKEDILLMQLTTDGLVRLFASDFPPLRLARNMGMNLLNRLPALKRQLLSHAMGKIKSTTTL